jgi:hypothetical protein
MRRWQLGLLAAANALIAVLLGVLSNVAAQVLPKTFVQNPRLVWAAVGVFTLTAIGCATPLALGRHSSGGTRQLSKPPSQNGVHVGRDLRIRGDRNTVAGGDISNVDGPQKGSTSARSERRRLRGK